MIQIRLLFAAVVLAVGTSGLPVAAQVHGGPGAPIAAGAVPTLASVVEAVTPGVVGISIGQQRSAANPLMNDPAFRRFFEESGKRRPERAREDDVRPAGSGVVIDAREG